MYEKNSRDGANMVYGITIDNPGLVLGLDLKIPTSHFCVILTHPDICEHILLQK